MLFCECKVKAENLLWFVVLVAITLAPSHLDDKTSPNIASTDRYILAKTFTI